MKAEVAQVPCLLRSYQDPLGRTGRPRPAIMGFACRGIPREINQVLGSPGPPNVPGTLLFAR